MMMVGIWIEDTRALMNAAFTQKWKDYYWSSLLGCQLAWSVQMGTLDAAV